MHLAAVVFLSVASSWKAGGQIFESYDVGIYSGPESILVYISNPPSRASDIDF